MTHRLVNGELIELTSEEKTEYDNMNKAWENDAFNRSIEKLRQERNDLLAETDWTANSDVTMSDAMKNYRQQLRDATEGLDTVEKVQAYKFPEEVLN